MTFADYVRHGWKLCPIREGEKRPRGDGWNRRENTITEPAHAEHLAGAGLCHAFSGTCAIDIDNMDLAREWLRERGIDLDALFNADDAVQITRGDASRGKLLYALPEPLPTKQIKNEDKTLMVLEFRCGATTGNSAQDVLPPTVHPSGAQYTWLFGIAGTWENLPPLPKPLHDLWLSMVARTQPKEPPVSGSLATVNPELGWVRTLLDSRDPDCDYDTWRDMGMRLHDGTDGGDDGFNLWHEWSAKGEKYPGEEALRAKWDSFGHGTGPKATLEGLRQEIVATDADFGPPLDQDLLAQADAVTRAARLAQFQWRRPSQIVTEPSPPWLIRDILPQEGINALYGPSGSGKSFEALDMGLAISRGSDWREYKTMQGAVGWIAAEAYGSMRNRLLAYCKTHNTTPDELVDFYVLGTSVRMQDAEQMKALTESARPLKLRLLIVDTLAAATPGTDENKGEDMSPVMENIARIYDQLGTTILLVHHTGKDETKGMRGHSSIKARVEAELLVKKRDGSPLRDLVPTKLRNSNKEGVLHPFKLTEVPVDMDDVGVITSASVEHVKLEDAQPAKKLDDNMKRGNSALALSTLESLWPVDGEPVINVDRFLGAYAESLLAPASGQDNRVTRAQNMLNSLAEKGIVIVDNATHTVTLIRSKLHLAASPREEDPDADLI